MWFLFCGFQQPGVIIADLADTLSKGKTMNRAEEPGRETRRRWQLWVLVCVIIASTLTVTGVALAQHNATVDFACWSVATGGGGKRTAPSLNYMLQDAVVGGVAGTMSSGSFKLRAGYAQSWAFLNPDTAATAAGQESTSVLYIPIISRFVQITRTCPG
jgi:hypothetical protein